MRYNLSSIINKAGSAMKAADVTIRQIVDDSTDCITKYFLGKKLGPQVQAAAMWDLAREMEEHPEFEVEDFTFGKSVKKYFAEYDSAAGKAWEKRSKGERLAYTKHWSDVIARTKKTGKTAAQRQSDKKKKALAKAKLAGAAEATATPLTYLQVLAAAKQLTAEEMVKLAVYLSKQVEGLSVKVA